MTTLTWTQVQPWLLKNPQRTKCVGPFIPKNRRVEGDIEVTDADGWAKLNVVPAMPLSAVLLAQDALYQATPEHARGAILRDETTDLQEKAVLLLKGRTWPVRRTSEGIVACGTEEGRASAWPSIGWRAICALRECQLLILNAEKKELSFFPEDVRAWSRDVDTFCVDSECRYVYTHATPHSILSSWIAKYEEDGWTMTWPIMEGSMEELKALVLKLQITLVGKHNKEALQTRIGKAQSLQLLSEWTE
jgi:ParB-like chromosome segregation protein Spo0J